MESAIDMSMTSTRLNNFLERYCFHIHISDNKSTFVKCNRAKESTQYR